jgi:hypothetical protein
MAEPFERFHPPEREQVRAILESVGLFDRVVTKSAVAQAREA